MRSTAAAGVLSSLGAKESSAAETENTHETTEPPRVFADIVLVNGQVLTMDHDDPDDITIAEAVAIGDKKILAVGNNDEVQRFIGPNTQRIHLGGKTVIPGLIDTHGHWHEYAIRHRAEEFFPQFVPVDVPFEEGTSFSSVKEDLLQAVEEKAAETESGQWVRVEGGRGSVIFNDEERPIVDVIRSEGITKDEVDDVAPDNPVELEAGIFAAVYNTSAIDLAREFYGELDPDMIDPETGVAVLSGMRAIRSDLIYARDPEAKQEMYREELQEATRDYGFTTWSSSFPQIDDMNTYIELDRRDEMPNRLAYTHSQGITNFSQGPEFYTRYGVLRGHGTDFVWNAGTSLTSIDSSYPSVKTTLDAPPEIKDREFTYVTPGSSRAETLRRQIRMGQRTAGNHVVGDAALDFVLDIIEEESLNADMSYEEIRAKRHGFDHVELWPREDQVPRLQKLGILPSFYMKTLQDGAEDAETIIDDYGEEALDQLLPVKRCVDAGLKPVMEWDDHIYPHGPFRQLESVVTRGPGAGPNPPEKVYNPDQAVDRMTALLMATRWASRYVLKEDVLGSIEKGKLADIVVLDKDYREIPDYQISELEVEMTIVDGNIYSIS